MPALMLTSAASLTCPHGAPGMVVPSAARVLVAGAPVALLTDTTTVAGCPFQIPFGVGTKPQPCMTVKWMVGAARVFAGGVPVLVQISTGLCLSAEQIPAGPPIVSSTQPRAMAT